MKTAIHNKQINPLSANITKWSNTLKQFVGKLPMNCLSVFDHFVGLALKGLSLLYQKNLEKAYSFALQIEKINHYSFTHRPFQLQIL